MLAARKCRLPGLMPPQPLAGTLKLLCLLWLAGVGHAHDLLAVPPVIPLIHEELRMSETQIGLLIGLPLALFAIAAVPGSLLIARVGAKLAVILGMVIAAVAGRRAAPLSTSGRSTRPPIATGFGIAIMQPGMPTLVREWLPDRIGIGTVVYSNGMVIGAILPPVLTIPFVLPLVGGSWRLDLLCLGRAGDSDRHRVLAAEPEGDAAHPARRRPRSAHCWWPDWRNPLIWLLGFTFGSNNSPFFAANAFLGDYLASRGQADLLGPALAWLNGAQLVALVLLFVVAGRLQRRAWPFLLFGPVMLAGFLGLILIQTPLAILVCSRIDRHHHGDDHDADAGAAAAAERARRRGAHRRRHVHHQLYLRDRHPDDLRRAVGHDRQAVDRVRAALPVRRRADGARLDREPAQSGRSMPRIR